MSTRDLINAIAAGDALEIENAFNATMAEKVSSRIDELRVDVAQNLFAEQAEEIEEETELNLEDYSLEEIEGFIMSEDFEQLDELSKDTLKSYINKRTDKSDFNHPYDPPESDDGHGADWQRKLTRKSDKADEKATAAKKAGDVKGYHKHMSKMYKHAADFNSDIEGYDVGAKHATGLSRAHARLSKSK